jgi:acyl transferase domain-containing protein
MAARFAGAPDLGGYWQNILDRREALREAPAGWDLGCYVPDADPADSHRIPTRVGGFLRGELRFDPVAFRVPPSMVTRSRPDPFMALQLAHAALADAGALEDRAARKRTGVVLGHISLTEHQDLAAASQQYGVDQVMAVLRDLIPELPGPRAAAVEAELRRQLRRLDPERLPSMVPSMIGGLVANRLDLRGPTCAVDAACASALVALDQACGLLRRGRCDLVLTGGIQFSVGPEQYAAFAQLGGLATSRVRPFTTEAEGTLLGEGGAVLALKRREDAERDGDRIYAVVQGVGLASDGTNQGLLTPSREGELRAIREAWEGAGLDPVDLGLVEAHGTGIPLGDATELEALHEFHGAHRSGRPRRALGGVKSMIGHCLAASGAAGLVKAALAIHHRVLPPSLGEEPCPELEAEGLFYLNTAPRPWVAGPGGRVASVSAFGFGGCNAHAVLQEWRPPEGPSFASFADRAPPASAPAPAPGRTDWRAELFLLGAEGPAGLLAQVRDLRATLGGVASPRLASLAAGTWERPRTGPCRLAVVARDLEDLRTRLDALLAGGEGGLCSTPDGMVRYHAGAEPGRLALLFPGEAAQRPEPLGDLFLHFSRLGEWLDFMVELHDADLPAEDVSLASLLYPPEDVAPAGLAASRAGVAAVWAAGFALVELLRELGVRADGMVGHSAGEPLAHFQAGVFGEPERSLARRAVATNLAGLGELQRDEAIPLCRGVAVGGLELERVEELLGEGLHLAMDNAPGQQVVFGPPEDLGEFEARVRDAGGILFPVPMGRPFHTPLYEAGTTQCREILAGEELHPPGVDLYSCVTAAPFPEERAAFEEVYARQWSERVRFRETLERMYADGYRTFLEVGPGATLAPFVRDTLRGRPVAALSCLPPRGDALAHWLGVLGELHVRGQDLEGQGLFRGRREVPPPPGGAVFEAPATRVTLSEETAASLRALVPGGARPASPQDPDLARRHFRFMDSVLEQQGRALDVLAEAMRRGGVSPDEEGSQDDG